jgi:hypothetical protein
MACVCSIVCLYVVAQYKPADTHCCKRKPCLCIVCMCACTLLRSASVRTHTPLQTRAVFVLCLLVCMYAVAQCKRADTHGLQAV